MKPGLKPGLATAALAALLLTTAAAVSAAHWLLDRKLMIAGPAGAPLPSEATIPVTRTVPVSVVVTRNNR